MYRACGASWTRFVRCIQPAEYCISWVGRQVPPARVLGRQGIQRQGEPQLLPGGVMAQPRRSGTCAIWMDLASSPSFSFTEPPSSSLSPRLAHHRLQCSAEARQLRELPAGGRKGCRRAGRTAMAADAELWGGAGEQQAADARAQCHPLRDALGHHLFRREVRRVHPQGLLRAANQHEEEERLSPRYGARDCHTLVFTALTRVLPSANLTP